MVDFTITLVGEEDSGLTEAQLDQVAELTLVAANIWGRYIDAPGVTLGIRLILTTETQTASARSRPTDTIETMTDGTEVFTYESILKLQTGVDVDELNEELLIQLNPERFDGFFFDPDPENRSSEVSFEDARDFISLMIHEIGHTLGFNGAGLRQPLVEIPNLLRQSVFDTFVEEIDGIVVFTGPNVRAVAGRNIELNGVGDGEAREELVSLYHLGNRPRVLTDSPLTFSDSPLADVGSDLSPSPLSGFGLANGARYYPTAIDIAILADLGVPVRKATERNDELYGFEAPDPEIEAFANFRIAEFLNGYDTLVGGAGDDTLYGLSGNDFLRGDAGNDHIIAGRGDDSVFAGASDEGNDTLEGNEGDDVLGGGAGDDTIVGGAFIADINPDDVPDAGSDTLFGGAGNDLLVAGSYDASTDTVINTGFNSNTLFAGSGHDTLYGGDQTDVLGGGTGNDLIIAGDRDDTLYGGAGTGADTLSGGDGDDEGFAGGGDDMIDGGAGNDLLFNGTGSDTVIGGSGNDTLFGGSGNDILTGGTGADTFAFVSGNGQDTITDFNTADDTLDLTAFNITSFAALQGMMSQQGGNTLIMLDDTTITLENVTVASITGDVVLL